MPRRLYVVPAGRYLVFVAGNIDLLHRPHVRNPDGTVSSVRSIDYDTDLVINGRKMHVWILIPTVVGNRVVSNREAWSYYLRTGQNLGIFKTARAAKIYSNLLHEEQAKLSGF